jgi:hypothetical protein
MHELLAHDELKPLRQKLEGLGSTSNADTEAEKARSANQVMSLIDAWFDVDVACQNGRIADGSPTLSGCTGANAVVYLLGAGGASKSAAMYQIKYLSKESVDISASASTLVDAAIHNRDYESTADDAGEASRNAKYFAQRVLNSVNMELDSTQAAAMVLGHRSSTHTDLMDYHYGSDMAKVARQCALFGSSGVGPDSDSDSDSDSDLDSEPEQDSVGKDSIGAGMERIRKAHDEHEDTGEEERKVMVDLLASESKTSKRGLSGIYKAADGTPTPMSSGRIYADRDKQLKKLFPVAFGLMFKLRRMNAKDKEWHTKEVASEKHDVTAGRPCERYRLLEPNPLHDSHIIVKKAKWGVPCFAGNSPPTFPVEPRGKLTKAFLRRRHDCARWWFSNFCSWDRDSWDPTDNEDPPDMTYEGWCSHMTELKKLAERRKLNETVEQFVTRYDAHAQLTVIENIMGGFTIPKETAAMSTAFRQRARTLWNGDGKEKMPTGGPGNKGVDKETAMLMNKIHEKVLNPGPEFSLV